MSRRVVVATIATSAVRAAAVATVAFGAATSVSAAPHYSIVNVNEQVGREHRFTATGLNASGQISGSAVYGSDPGGRLVVKPVVYDGSELRVVGLSDGRRGEARAINGAGHTTGMTEAANVSGHFAFLDDGHARILQAPNNVEAIGNAINAHDQIAGVYTGRWNDPGDLSGRANPRPFFYDGAFHDLGLAGGVDGEAVALNDAGVVVGSIAMGHAGIVAYHALRYDGQPHDLGTLPGCSSSRATSINNHGTIVGTASLCENRGTHAFVYDGAMREIPGLENAVSTATAINSAGDIVGSVAANRASRAILIQGGTKTDLNAQVPGLRDVVLFEAIAINDAGQILARGSGGDAYLLTPMPESEAAGLIQKNADDAAAKQAAQLASVDVWSGTQAKITRDGDTTTLSYADAAKRPHSFVVVRSKMSPGMLGNGDAGGWIYVAPDRKSGVMFNVSASGGVSGKPMNPLMMQMMVGP